MNLISRAAQTLFTCLILSSFSAHAAVVKGPFTFDDDAFIDDASLISGSTTLFGGVATVSEALSGTNLSAGVDFDGNEVFEITFTDNVVTNNAGEDLILFERGNDAEDLRVSAFDGIAFTSFLTFSPTITFVEGGANQNAILIDIADFGFSAGDEVSVFRVKTGNTLAEFVGGASTSVPSPGTGVLLLIGLLLTKRRTIG